MLNTIILEREECCFCRGSRDRPGGEGMSVFFAFGNKGSSLSAPCPSAGCAEAQHGRKW